MATAGHKSKPYQMRARVVVAPTVTPISLAEVKSHLRLTATTDDAYLTSLIGVATDLLQEYCHRKFVQQSMEGWLDIESLMSNWWDGSITSAISAMQSFRTIELPWAPTLSVISVSVFTLDDTEIVVDPLTYRVDSVDLGMPARITLKESQVWPGGSYRNQNSLKVAWLSGYGPAATDVPVGLRMATQQMVAYLYNNRGDCSGDCVGACGANMLAQPYRIYSL